MSGEADSLEQQEMEERMEAEEAYRQSQLDSRYAIVCKDTFYQLLDQYYTGHSIKRPWSAEYLQQAIRDMRSIRQKTGFKKTARHYCLLRRYELVETGDSSLIIARPKEQAGIPADTSIRRQVIAYEHLYDRLLDLHLKMGHSRRDKMNRVIRRNFLIPRFVIVTFLQLCKVCATHKLKRTRYRMVQSPPAQQQQQVEFPVPLALTVSSRVDQVQNDVAAAAVTLQGDVATVQRDVATDSGFNGHGQVDVIDFRHMPDGEYKWLLRYEDLATKFVSLRPLKSESSDYVADELLKLFLQFGAPLILQSSSGGRRLVAEVLTVLLKSWPTCQIMNAHHKNGICQEAHSQLLETMDTLETLLRAWMHEYSTSNWSVGCYFVQWRRNTSKHHEIGKTPYAATFGVTPKIGLRPPRLTAQQLLPSSPPPSSPSAVPQSPATLSASTDTWPKKRRRKLVLAAQRRANHRQELPTMSVTIDHHHHHQNGELHEAEAETALETGEILSSYVLVLDPSDVIGDGSAVPSNEEEDEQNSRNDSDHA